MAHNEYYSPSMVIMVEVVAEVAGFVSEVTTVGVAEIVGIASEVTDAVETAALETGDFTLLLICQAIVK
jgi:hypothetical protein